MGKQMEGDNKFRRKIARKAREAGQKASELGATVGGSKQRSHVANNADHEERLSNIQQGEAKQGGPEVPRPLRGKGRSRDADAG